MYSTKSQITKEVCKVIGANFNISFVETMKRNGKIYVKGTLGKPDEFRWLKNQCNKYSYIYTGTI